MVFAYLVTLKLRRAEDVPTFLRLFEPLRVYCNEREPSTLTYEALRSETCDRTILILERYRTVQDLEVTHRGSEPFQAFCNQLGPLDIIESKENGRFHEDLLPKWQLEERELSKKEEGSASSSSFAGALVFCGARVGANPAYVAEGAALGKALAERHIPLVYGGGTVGVMGALATAAQAHRGTIRAVIPRSMVPREVSGDCIGDVYLVHTMAERKSLMFGMADLVMALPGGIGTFDELLEVLTLFQLNAYRPRIGLINVNGYFEPFLAMLKQMIQEGFLEEAALGFFVVKPTAVEVLDALTSEAYVKPESPAKLQWTAKP